VRGKENDSTLPVVIVPRRLRHPGLRLLSLVLSVGSLVLLLVLLLGGGTNITQAAPSLSQLLFRHYPQESCDEPGNLAPNPGFECAGASPGEAADWKYDTWEGPPAIFFRSRQLRHSGDYSVFIGSGSTVSRSRWRSKPIPAYEGRIYEFSVWVNADQLSDKANVSLTFWSGWPPESDVLGWASAEGTGNTSGEWVQLVSSHMAPPRTRYIRLECRLYGAGTVWFDDAAIYEYKEGPVLGLAQSDNPDPVRPNDPLVYTLVYSNTGNSTASNVVITNTFDANVQFTGDANPPPTSGSGRAWYWHPGSLPPDGSRQIVITATVKPSVADGTVLVNQVEWRSDQTSGRLDWEETLVHSVPILTIRKTDMPDPVTAGERLTYTIVYTNSGTAPATSIFLTECYPPPTVFITATRAPLNPPANTLWQMPDLLPGGTQSVTIVMSVTESATGGIVFNNVWLVSRETPMLFVQESTVITGQPKPPYLITISPECQNVSVKAGEIVSVPYVVSNAGSQPLTNIAMAASTLQSWKGSAQIEPANIGSLPSGASHTVILTVRPAPDEISDTYSAQVIAVSSETSAQAEAKVNVPQYWGVLIEPDNMVDLQPCNEVMFTHWITNLGNFTDTITLEVFPTPSWSVTPTSVTLPDIGIGKVKLFTVTVGVPCTAQITDVGRAIVQAASATSPKEEEDFALDFIRVISPTWKIFLPVVMKDHIPPKDFCNGDFEEPLGPCWATSETVSRRCASGNCFARLGTEADDVASCQANMKSSTAELQQVFHPAATGVLTLSFEYTVHSLDVLWTDFDYMAVYVDATKIFTTTYEHTHFGCTDSVPPLPDHPITPTGTVERLIPITKGVPVTLKFRLFNDQWYNTYVDIDNVRITYVR